MSLYLVYSVLLAIGFVLALPFYLWKGRSTGQVPGHVPRADGPLPGGLAERQRRAVDLDPRGVGGRGAGGARPWWRRSRSGSPSAASSSPRPPPPATRWRGRACAPRTALLFAPFDWPGPVRRALRGAGPRAARPGGDGDLAEPDPRGAAARGARGDRERPDLAAVVPALPPDPRAAAAGPGRGGRVPDAGRGPRRPREATWARRRRGCG